VYAVVTAALFHGAFSHLHGALAHFFL